MPLALKVIVYPLYTILLLFFFFVVLFPYESVKLRVAGEMEKALGGGYSIQIGRLTPFPMTGVILKDVEVRERGVADAKPVKISKAKLKFSLLPLLSGAFSVNMDLQMGSGSLKGNFFWKKINMGMNGKFQNFDLAIANLFTKKIGVELAGLMNGQVQMDINEQDPLRNEGHILLEIPNLKMGEMSFGGGVFQLPALELAQPASPVSTIDISVVHGTFDIKQFELVGGDVSLKADGKIYGARKMDNYRFNLKGVLNLKPEVISKIPILSTLEKQKSPDGSYPLTITGRLTSPSIRIGEFKVPI